MQRSITTLEPCGKRLCEVGALGTLEGKVRETPPVEPKFTGEIEAHIQGEATSASPVNLGWAARSIRLQKFLPIY